MSLAVLADHMASRGRGPDSMLIHMSPREVQGLQALAENHGGSLTINPETGLPEAGFLDKLLPTIIGAGISYFSGGTIDPKTAAMIVGGVQTVRTGDIGKGIQAGLGAYGGATLTAGMSATGAEAIGGGAAADAYAGLGATAITDAQAIAQGFGSAEELMQTKAALAGQQAASTATPFQTLSAGASKAATNPMQYLKANAIPLAGAFGPAILAEMSAKENMPKTTTGMIAPHTFDPYSGTYTAGVQYPAKPTYGAEGGLMGLAAGGIAGYGDGDDVPRQNGMAQGGMYDFAQRSEPVVRMAEGGITQQQVSDWFKANPNATPEQVAQTVQGLGGLAANEGLADLIGKQYGMSGTNIGSIYDTLTYQPTMANSQPQQATPVTSTETMANNMAQQNKLQDYVDQIRATQPDYQKWLTSGDITSFAQRNQIDPNIAARFGKEYDFANSSQVRDAFSDPRTRSADVVYKLQEQGVSPEAVARYTGITPERASEIYTNSVKDKPKLYSGNLGTVIPAGLEALAAAPSAAQPPAGGYTQFTNEQIGKYLADNPNADIQKAIKDTNADPAAVNRYITSLTSGYKDPTATAGGSGTLGIYNQMKALGIDANELSSAAKALNPTNAGWSAADIGKQYNLGKGAYALTEQLAKDKVAADAKLGYDKEWVKFMDTNKYSVSDAAKAFGLPINEVQRRYDAVKAAEKKVDKGTGTGVDLGTSPITYAPPGTRNPYGNVTNPGDQTINTDGSVTVTPNIPARPYGGFPGMESVRDAYTKGGGSLGYTPYTPQTIEEFDTKYGSRLTGGSKQSLDYLTGKTKYSPVPYTPTGEVMKPYAESVLGVPMASSKKMYLFDPTTKTYKINPDYAIPTYDKDGKKSLAITNQDVINYVKSPEYSNDDAFVSWMTSNNLTPEQIAAATGMSIADVYKKIKKAKPVETVANTTVTGQNDGGGGGDANGGLMKLAGGGMSGQFNLGDYSDGGRLLRGPGDGVSDSIPASIGGKRPARLADGEFVVPARIVSELGNGSTEAGARKLYAMMDRIQSARRGTVGKGRVAKNSRSEKYLPA